MECNSYGGCNTCNVCNSNNCKCETGRIATLSPILVKQWYESNNDTNVFTNDEKAKLLRLASLTTLDGKDGINGLDGVTGLAGADGRDGHDGRDGITGNDGKQGYQGIPGKDGIDGANVPVPGPRGIDGLRGDPGITGVDGKDGKDGLDGMSIIGPKGDEGDRGLQGIPGAIGHIGLDGHIGVDGRAGISGVPGPRGQVGANGLDGKDGTVGGIVGNDTEANILLKSGNVGEMWIITDPAKAGQGLLSDGNGSGSTHWTNIGQLAGPRGVQGIQGLDGADGNTGLPGPVGPQSIIPGPPGSIGLTGAQGADSVVAGPVGVQGVKGDDGDKGDPGTPILTYIAEADLPPVGDMTKIYKVNRNATGLYDIRYLVWDNIHNDYIPLPADVASSADGSVGYREFLTSSLTIKEDRSNLDVVGDMGHRQINVYDRTHWKTIYDEEEIKKWIAAAAKFEGVVAENGHSLGTGVRQFSDLAGMLGNFTEAELLLRVGHYFTWSGVNGYVIQAADLGGELVGDVMQTNDWLQLVNSGGKVTDPSDPNYATQHPVYHTVHISGDSLSKDRADGLYSFSMWRHKEYETGSLVTYGGKVYKALYAVTGADDAPDAPMSKWIEIDLSGVAPMTYFGRGGFDFTATTYDTMNDWGMPTNTHPNPHKRRVHDGDRYIDLDHGSEVDFKVDAVTHDVTATHSFGHTRDMSFTMDASVVATDKVTLLANIPVGVEGVIKFSVIDKSKSGLVAEFEFITAGTQTTINPLVIVPSGNPMFNYVVAETNALGNYDIVFMLEENSKSQDIEVEIHSLDYDLGIFTRPDGTASTIPVGTTDIFTSLKYPFPNRIMLTDNGDVVAEDHNDKDVLFEKNVAGDAIENIHIRDGQNMLSFGGGSGGGNPVGTIIQHISYTPPQGYLFCNGVTFDAVAYPKLYALLGNVDKLPDLRNQFIRGAASQSQITGFVKRRWTTAKPRSQFKTNTTGSHRHVFDNDTSEGDTGAGAIVSGAGHGNQSINRTYILAAGDHYHYVTLGGDAETAPDHIRLAYHIKAI